MSVNCSAPEVWKELYFIASDAEDGDHIWSRAVSGLEGWLECFERAHLSGVVFGGGVTDAGEVENYPAMTKAYEMGKKI